MGWWFGLTHHEIDDFVRMDHEKRACDDDQTATRFNAQRRKFLRLQLARHIQGEKRGHNEMAWISPNVLNDGDLQER